ncbi:hypothetical protein [Arthrobacter sp. JSM 101049]|uniref:hypothetical protein n=1 Tax=Arthrobacter sp. JSM 101049 TaxID=929097 RepID=UPI003569208C
MTLAPREAELLREIQALDREGIGVEALTRVRDQLQAAHALKSRLATLVADHSPEQASRAQAAESAWRSIDREFGLLSGAEVAQRCGSTSTGRSSYATDARRSGRLLAVKRLNRYLYPAFQLGPDGPLEVIATLKAAADRLDVGEEATLLWLTAPTTWWDADSRPVDHLDDPDGILAAFAAHYGASW